MIRGRLDRGLSSAPVDARARRMVDATPLRHSVALQGRGAAARVCYRRDMDCTDDSAKVGVARRGGFGRVRELAAPFVVTVSLVGACTGSTTNPPPDTDFTSETSGTSGTDADTDTEGATAGTSGTEGGTGTTAGGSTSQTEETVNPPITTGSMTDATTSGSTTGPTTGATSDSGATDSSDTGGSFDPDDDGVQLCGGDYPMDPVDITSGVVNGDTLTLSVAYGGGCEEHDFGLCWDNLFLESEPVQVNLALAHDGMGDACEAYIMEDLVLDLTSLKQAYQEAYQTDTGTITIHVDGLDGPITYSF